MSPRRPIFWLIVASTFVSTPHARGEIPGSTDPPFAAVTGLSGDPLLTGAVGLCAPAIQRAESAPADPVEELRAALRPSLQADTSKEALESYKKNLGRRADVVNRFADLGRALLLQEWQDHDQR